MNLQRTRRILASQDKDAGSSISLREIKQMCHRSLFINVYSKCWAGKIDQPWHMKIGEKIDGQDEGFFPMLGVETTLPGGSRVTIALTSSQIRTTPLWEHL